jgi:hypothetical protein
MARYDDLKTGPIAYAALVSTILLLVIILLVRALCYSWIEAEDAKKLAEAHYFAADVEVSRQKEQISSYRKEIVPATSPTENEDVQPAEEERLVIPVERAKELLLQDLRVETSPEI